MLARAGLQGNGMYWFKSQDRGTGIFYPDFGIGGYMSLGPTGTIYYQDAWVNILI
jgi:hypothetical protein